MDGEQIQMLYLCKFYKFNLQIITRNKIINQNFGQNRQKVSVKMIYSCVFN